MSSTWLVIAELTGPPFAMFVVSAIATASIVVVVPIVLFAIGVMLIPIVLVVPIATFTVSVTVIPIVTVLPIVMSAMVSCGLQCFVAIW